MGSLEKSIILIIFSVSIMSSQAACTVQKGPTIEESFIKGIDKAISSFAPITMQPILTFTLGVFSNILYNSLNEDKPGFNHSEAFEKLQIRIDNQFDAIKSLVNNESQRVISSLITYSDEKTIFNEGLLKLSELKEEYNNDFLRCVKQKKCDERTRQEYMNDYIEKGHKEVSEILRRFVFRDGTGDHGKRIFEVILQSFEYVDQYGRKNRCADEIQQRQRYIYHIYFHIFGIINQHYEKIVYSQAHKYKNYKSVNSSDADNIFPHMENTFNDMKEDLILTTKAAKSALKKIPRDSTRLCDPKTNEKGKTYDQLTYFIQAYVVPEDSLEPGPTIGDAKTYFDQRCDAKSPPPFYVWPQSRYECHTFRQLVNCKYLAQSVSFISWKREGYGLRFFKTLDKSGSGEKEYGMWSEDLVNDVLVEHVNRYVYHQSKVPLGILYNEFKESRIYDRMQPFYICDLDSLNPNYSGIENVHPTIEGPVEKFLRKVSPDFGEFYDNTVRKFSELPVQASSGKFVTGVRFRVLNKIIYMQIQQGNYISGMIDPASLEWKKIDENQEKVQELNIHRRTFNLDDVEVPLGSFVTGVKFVFNQDTISLGVYGTEVDKDGEILHDGTEYEIPTTFYPPPLNLNQRQEIKLEKPGPSDWAPTDTRHEIKSKPGISFVRFQLTDPEKDLHTTVPYLDIRDVVDTELKPLGGIGIEYRGKEGYGGFIGFKLISTDIISKLNVDELVNAFDDFAKNLTDQLRNTV